MVTSQPAALTSKAAMQASLTLGCPHVSGPHAQQFTWQPLAPVCRLEIEKDLADIDSSNIVRQRRTRQHVNYAAIDKLSGSESSSEKGEGRAAVQPSASPLATGTASDDTDSEDFQAGASGSEEDEGAAQSGSGAAQSDTSE